MKYDQLPLPIDAQMLHTEWRALGYAVLICPGCKAGVSYPANTNMYAVVCKCGWFTEVDEHNVIWWHAPKSVWDAIAQRFLDTKSNN